MDDQQVRAAALIAAAINQSSTGVPLDLLIFNADQLVPYITGPSGPVSMTLSLGGTVPLSIDSVNARAVLEFEDRDGDKVAPPAGATATVTSSDTAVLTAGAGQPGTDAGGVATIEFPLTAVSAGTAALSVHATAADGSPLAGPSGTPIPDAPPVTVTVQPGAAAEEVFTVPGA